MVTDAGLFLFNSCFNSFSVDLSSSESEVKSSFPNEILPEASAPILQDVRGIGPKVAVELRKHGITEIRQLARAPEEVLQQDVKFLGEKTAKRVREAAQVTLHKKKSNQNKIESIQALQDRLKKSNK